MMTVALERVRVLDFTTTIAGPHCGRLLADLGAEVIKIEAPEGDMMRTRPPLRNGASTSFGQLNAGKKSLVLDLKTPQAVEVARRLVATADAVGEIPAAQFAVAAPGRPVFGPIATKDGYVNLAIASERTVQALAAAFGHPQWVTDERFAKYPDRRANWGDLIDELERWSKERTT